MKRLNFPRHQLSVIHFHTLTGLTDCLVPRKQTDCIGAPKIELFVESVGTSQNAEQNQAQFSA